jgi:hypothetical protein
MTKYEPYGLYDLSGPLHRSPYRGLIVPRIIKTQRWQDGKFQYPFIFRASGEPLASWDVQKKDEEKNYWHFGLTRMLPIDEWRIYKPAFLSAINSLFDVVFYNRSHVDGDLYDTHLWYDDTKYPPIEKRSDSFIEIVCCNSARTRVGTPEQTAEYIKAGLIDARQLVPDDIVCSWGQTETKRGKGYAAFRGNLFMNFQTLDVLEESIGSYKAGHVIQSLKEAEEIAKLYAARWK